MAGCAKSVETNSHGQQFLKFVSSKPKLSSPPVHSFRVVMLNKSSPDVHFLSWGSVDEFNRSFKVALVKNQPNVFPAEGGVRYNDLSKKLEPLKDYQNYDWINGGNEVYGFGVKQDANSDGFLLNGVEDMPKAVITSSCMPFASFFDRCYLVSLFDLYEIESFAKSVDESYPDAFALSMNSKKAAFSKVLYFDADDGYCLGEQVLEASVVTTKTIYRYEMSNEGKVFKAAEIYIGSKEKPVELERIHYFLDWKLGGSLDQDKCYVSYYGFPEPGFGKKPSTLWWYVCVVAIVGFLSLSIFLKRK